MFSQMEMLDPLLKIAKFDNISNFQAKILIYIDVKQEAIYSLCNLIEKSTME